MHAQPSPLALALTLGLLGCGYTWVAPRPIAAALDPIVDTTTEGDLGLHCAQALARHLDPAEGRRLSGRLSVLTDTPMGFDSTGRATVFRVVLALELTLTVEGLARWGDTSRAEGFYLSGETPLATRANRRSALLLAAERAAEDAALRLANQGEQP